MTIKLVKQGKRLLPSAPWLWDAYVERLEDGTEVLCELRAPGRTRSLDQNAYLHKLIERYGETIGESRVYAKDEACLLWGVAEEIDIADGFDIANRFMEDRGYPVWPCIHWGRYWLRKSTAHYNTKEMTALIDGLKRGIVEAGGTVADLEVAA